MEEEPLSSGTYLQNVAASHTLGSIFSPVAKCILPLSVLYSCTEFWDRHNFISPNYSGLLSVWISMEFVLFCFVLFLAFHYSHLPPISPLENHWEAGESPSVHFRGWNATAQGQVEQAAGRWPRVRSRWIEQCRKTAGSKHYEGQKGPGCLGPGSKSSRSDQVERVTGGQTRHVTSGKEETEGN